MAASSSSSSIDSILSKLAALQESVDCVICRGRLQRPVVTVCGHTFCGRCVDKTFEAAASTTGGRRGGGGKGKGTSCPLCVTPLHKRSICETERTRSIVEAIQKVADVAKATFKASFPSAFVADACVMTSNSLTQLNQAEDNTKNSSLCPNSNATTRSASHTQRIDSNASPPGTSRVTSGSENRRKRSEEDGAPPKSPSPEEICLDASYDDRSDRHKDKCVADRDHIENEDNDNLHLDESVVPLASSKRRISRRDQRQEDNDNDDDDVDKLEDEDEEDEQEIIARMNRRRRESALCLSRAITPLNSDAISREEQSWLKAVKSGPAGRWNNYNNNNINNKNNNRFLRTYSRKRKFPDQDSSVQISDPSDDEIVERKRPSQTHGQTKGIRDREDESSRRRRILAKSVNEDDDRNKNKRALDCGDRTRNDRYESTEIVPEKQREPRSPFIDEYAFISSCSQSSPETSQMRRKKLQQRKRLLQQQQRQQLRGKSRIRGDVAGLRQTAQRIKEAYLENARRKRELRRATRNVSEDAVGMTGAAGESVAEYSGGVGVRGGVSESEPQDTAGVLEGVRRHNEMESQVNAISLIEKDRLSRDVFSDGRGATTTEDEERQDEDRDHGGRVGTRVKDGSCKVAVSAKRPNVRPSANRLMGRTSRYRGKESDSDTISIHSVPSVESLEDKSEENGLLMSPSQPNLMKGRETEAERGCFPEASGGDNQIGQRGNAEGVATKMNKDGKITSGDDLPQYLFPHDSQEDKPTQQYHIPETPISSSISKAGPSAASPLRHQNAQSSSALTMNTASSPAPKTPPPGIVKSCLRLTPGTAGSGKGVRFGPDVKNGARDRKLDYAAGKADAVVRSNERERPKASGSDSGRLSCDGGSDSDSVLPTPGCETALTRMKNKLRSGNDGGGRGGGGGAEGGLGVLKIRKLSKNRKLSTVSDPPIGDLESLRSAVATSPARSLPVATSPAATTTSPANLSDAVKHSKPISDRESKTALPQQTQPSAEMREDSMSVTPVSVAPYLQTRQDAVCDVSSKLSEPTTKVRATLDSDHEKVVPDTFSQVNEEFLFNDDKAKNTDFRENSNSGVVVAEAPDSASITKLATNQLLTTSIEAALTAKMMSAEASTIPDECKDSGLRNSTEKDMSKKTTENLSDSALNIPAAPIPANYVISATENPTPDSQGNDPITVIVNEGDDFESEYLTNRFNADFDDSFEGNLEEAITAHSAGKAREEQNRGNDLKEEIESIGRLKNGPRSGDVNGTDASDVLSFGGDGVFRNSDIAEPHGDENTGTYIDWIEKEKGGQVASNDAINQDIFKTPVVPPYDHSPIFSPSHEIFTPVSLEDLEVMKAAVCESEVESPTPSNKGLNSKGSVDPAVSFREGNESEGGRKSPEGKNQVDDEENDDLKSKPAETMDILANLSFTPSSRKCFSIEDLDSRQEQEIRKEKSLRVSADGLRTKEKHNDKSPSSFPNASEMSSRDPCNSAKNSANVREFELCDNASFQAAFCQTRQDPKDTNGREEKETKETLDIYDKFDLCSAEVEEMFRPFEEQEKKKEKSQKDSRDSKRVDSDDIKVAASRDSNRVNSGDIQAAASRDSNRVDSDDIQAMMEPFSQIPANVSKEPSLKSSQSSTPKQEFQLCSNDFDEPFTQVSQVHVGVNPIKGNEGGSCSPRESVTNGLSTEKSESANDSIDNRRGDVAPVSHSTTENPLQRQLDSDPFPDDPDDDDFFHRSSPLATDAMIGDIVKDSGNAKDNDVAKNGDVDNADEVDDEDVDELPSSLDPNASTGKFRPLSKLSSKRSGSKSYDICSNATVIGSIAASASKASTGSPSTNKFDLCSVALSRASGSPMPNSTKSPSAKSFSLCDKATGQSLPDGSTKNAASPSDSPFLIPKIDSPRAVGKSSQAAKSSKIAPSATSASPGPSLNNAISQRASTLTGASSIGSTKSPAADRFNLCSNLSKTLQSPHGSKNSPKSLDSLRKSTGNAQLDRGFGPSSSDWLDDEGASQVKTTSQPIASYDEFVPFSLEPFDFEETNLADRIKRGRRNTSTLSPGSGTGKNESPHGRERHQSPFSKASTGRKGKGKGSFTDGRKEDVIPTRDPQPNAMSGEEVREKNAGKIGADVSGGVELKGGNEQAIDANDCKNDNDQMGPCGPVASFESCVDFVNLCSEEEEAQERDATIRISTQDLSSTQREERLAKNIRIDEQRQEDFERKQKGLRGKMVKVKEEVVSNDEEEEGFDDVETRKEKATLSESKRKVSVKGIFPERQAARAVTTPVAVINPISSSPTAAAAASASASFFSGKKGADDTDNDDEDDDDDDDESLEYSTAKLREIQREMAEIRKKLAMDSSTGEGSLMDSVGDAGENSVLADDAGRVGKVGGCSVMDGDMGSFGNAGDIGDGGIGHSSVVSVNIADEIDERVRKMETNSRTGRRESDFHPNDVPTKESKAVEEGELEEEIVSTPRKTNCLTTVEFFTPKSKLRSLRGESESARQSSSGSPALRDQLLEELQAMHRFSNSPQMAENASESSAFATRRFSRPSTPVNDDLPSTSATSHPSSPISTHRDNPLPTPTSRQSPISLSRAPSTSHATPTTRRPPPTSTFSPSPPKAMSASQLTEWRERSMEEDPDFCSSLANCRQLLSSIAGVKKNIMRVKYGEDEEGEEAGEIEMEGQSYRGRSEANPVRNIAGSNPRAVSTQRTSARKAPPTLSVSPVTPPRQRRRINDDDDDDDDEDIVIPDTPGSEPALRPIENFFASRRKKSKDKVRKSLHKSYDSTSKNEDAATDTKGESKGKSRYRNDNEESEPVIEDASLDFISRNAASASYSAPAGPSIPPLTFGQHLDICDDFVMDDDDGFIVDDMETASALHRQSKGKRSQTKKRPLDFIL